jgi:hypothetical protein
MDLVLVFSACRYPVFLATFVEETVFSSWYSLGAFVKNQMGVAVWIHTWVFYSVPLFSCPSIMLFLLLGLCTIV